MNMLDMGCRKGTENCTNYLVDCDECIHQFDATKKDHYKYKHEYVEKCPDCGNMSVKSAGVGGGVKCYTEGCNYWFCY